MWGLSLAEHVRHASAKQRANDVWNLSLRPLVRHEDPERSPIVAFSVQQPTD